MTDAVCDALDLPIGTQSARAGRLVNQALTELCSTFRFATPLATLTVIAGQGDYSIATGLGVSDAAQIRDVFYKPVAYASAGPPLERTSASRIDDIRNQAVSNTYPMQYAVSGVDTLMLAPVPSDAGQLSVRYVQDGDQLGARSDVPLTMPAEFHDVIWRQAAIELGEIMRPAAVSALAARQQVRLGDLRSWLVDLAGEKPLRMQRRGDSIPVNDPSIYPVLPNV